MGAHQGRAVIEFGGWQFPDGEEHLVEMMDKVRIVVNGRLSYQYQKLTLAMQHVGQRRRAVDVGCHIGLWAWHLADLFDHVDAFEPMPAHRECFLENVHAQNVTLWSCALGASEGAVSLTSCVGNSGHSHVAEGGEIKATMRTLDSFGFIDLDFLKIDTEGYELEVLRGAVKTLKRCKPTIIVEQKANNGSRYGYDDRAALPFLHNLGARIVAERSRDYILIWPRG